MVNTAPVNPALINKVTENDAPGFCVAMKTMSADADAGSTVTFPPLNVVVKEADGAESVARTCTVAVCSCEAAAVW